MIGKLLTTSAMVLVLSGAAYAAGSMTTPRSAGNQRLQSQAVAAGG